MTPEVAEAMAMVGLGLQVAGLSGSVLVALLLWLVFGGGPSQGT